MSKSFWARESTDLWTTIITAAVASVAVIVIAVLRMLDLVAVDGITVTVPIVDGAPADVPFGAGEPIAATVLEAQIVSDAFAPATVASFVASIIVPAVTYLLVIACAVAFCVNLMRGRAFGRANTRLMLAASLIILFGALLTQMFTMTGINGAYAAIGQEFDGQADIMGGFWPAYLAAMGLGAVAIAFRRGELLQRDSEGLV